MIQRRDLLAGAAAAFALPSIRLAQAQEYRVANHTLKLGVASYSFRKFPRAQAIQMMKTLGTPYLNLKDAHLPLTSSPEEIAEAKQEFTAAGLVITGCGTIGFTKDDDSDIRQKFEYAKLLGAPLMVCAPTREILPKLERYVKEYDIKIAVHNHGPEDKNFPAPSDVLAIVKSLDPRCGLCIDIGHTTRAGADVVQSIADAGPRLFDLHMKDLGEPGVKESQVAVGQGKIPIAGIFRQLVQMGYQGCADLEYEIQPADPMPGMEQSFSYMRGVIAGLQAAA